MKAIRVERYGDPSVLQLVDMPIPVPGSEQVLVKVYAVGVNPVETYYRSGMRKVSHFPYTPGTDAAGIVEQVGNEVIGIKKGDRVFITGSTTGTYAQYALAHMSNVLPLPDTLSFEQGAGIHIPYYTAYHAIYHVTMCKPREVILVHGGSGAVGIASIQLARMLGMKVIATAGTDAGLKLVSDAGAHLALNYKDSGYIDKILEFTDRKGPDVILEMLANANLDFDCKIIAQKGRIAIIGSRDSVTITPRDLMSKRASVHGVFLSLATQPEIEDMNAALVRAIELGVVKPHISKIFPLAEAAKAHEEVITPSAGGALGKIVLTPWN